MMSRRLMIFGCGYVGTELARQAMALGWEIKALTRNPQQAGKLEALGARVIVADLHSSNWHSQAAGPFDYAVNCVSAGSAGLEGYRMSYCEGMQSILAWADRQPQPLTALAYTSSTSVYAVDADWVDESAPLVQLSPTGEILRAAEVLLEEWPQGQSVRTIILRLAGIYGPARHRLLDQVRLGARELSGRGDSFLNLIHRDDAAGALLAVLQAPTARGVFNCCDGQPATRAEITAWLAGRLGLPEPVWSGPSSENRLFRGEGPNRRISSHKLQQATDWRPCYRDFRAGYAAILGEV